MNKLISIEAFVPLVEEGCTIMIGGFMAVGTPVRLIDALVDEGTKNMTLICTDTATETTGIGKLVVNKQFKKITASHIGLNKETGRQLTDKETEVVLVPQGTLAEQIRAGGAGLGGFLTPTGLGTIVAEGKEVIHVNGRDYLLELPLRADVALVKGTIVDKAGNVYIEKTARNFNPLMAMAADTVVVEADQLVEVGEIDPHLVMIPGILVDYIVMGGESCG